MAHEVETMVSAEGKVPWHGLGTVIEDEGMTSVQALDLGGLNWEVEKLPAFAQVQDVNDEGEEITRYLAGEKMYLNTRMSDNRPLGMVGDRYEVLQNKDAFLFGDDLIDDSGAHWITAGSLKQGRTVWMMMKMPETVKIDGYEDEAIQPYVLITNSHDGSSSVTAAITPVRVVCNNTLTWALAGTPRQFKIRHTTKMMGRINEAKRVLGVTHAYMDAMSEVAAGMLNTKFSDKEFDAFLESLSPTADREKAALTRALDRQETIKGIWKNKDDLQNIRNTQWGALQAVVDYNDHHIDGRGDNKEETRFSRILTSPNLTHQAFKVLQEA